MSTSTKLYLATVAFGAIVGLTAGLSISWYQNHTIVINSAGIQLEPHEHIIGYDSVGDVGHHHVSVSSVFIAPRDMWVRQISMSIQNAPATTLHHAALLRIDRLDPMCPKHDGESLATFAQDQMHTPYTNFPDGYAIFIPQGTPLQLVAMFHNPEPPVGPGGDYTDVHVRVKLHLADADADTLTPLRFRLLRLADSPCDADPVTARVFSVPVHTEGYTFAGMQTAEDTAQLTIETPTRIVYWGAHIHGWEGGKNLAVRVNDEPVETFFAEQDFHNQYLYHVPHERTDRLLMPGDTIRIETTYDNMTDAVVRGAMGQLGMYIAEE